MIKMNLWNTRFAAIGWMMLGGALVSSGAEQPATTVPPAAPTAEVQPLAKTEAAENLSETETLDLGDGVKMEFVLIRPGSFQMGSDRNQYDERPVRKVTLTQPYYLGKYEVTQAQWEKIMGNNPSHFKDPNRPVENVSWEDCQRFLAALRKKVARNVVLPTEAQWEYACRAGTTTAYSFGDDVEALSEYSWHSANSDLTTHPVGQKKPNPWGLYDIHGNVFEWCADWYSANYPRGEAVDPKGSAKGSRRVIRGGAWLYVADNHRSSDRGFSPPDYVINEYGLRCALLLTDVPSADESTAGGAAPSSPPLDPLAQLLARVEAELVKGNKLYAEILVDEAERRGAPEDRIFTLRTKITALPPPKETVTVELTPGVSMEFILIRPGTFQMGSEESPLLNEKPVHQVTITQPFYLGKFEVTQKQWTSLMERNLSTFKGAPPQRDPSQLPVENVSWNLCKIFLDRLTEKFPDYVFRFPTEAEWEYACRAGTTGQHHMPEGAALEDYAWFGENAEGQTHPVGSKKPNPWGLYDMYGNVWEWCQDPFAPYSAEPVEDPTGPDSSPSGTRVVRGGAWNNLGKHVNSTYRHDVGPEILMRYYGFRCVAVPAGAQKANAQ